MNYTNLVLRHFSKLLVLGTAMFTLASCDDDDATMPVESSTITEMVVANPNFSLLEAAVVKAGLAETLAGNGPYTVFAPDNAAFEASGITSATIQSLSAETLREILLYHTVSGRVMAANVPAGPNAAVETANNDPFYLTKNNAGVFVNGTKVKQADVAADNGVIHVISKVLMPAAGNIVEVASENDNLSFLVAAVVRASEGDTDVAAALSSAGPLTVFAPTNQAFIAAGFPSIQAIQAADPNTLASILTYHVIAARVFSSDLVNGADVTTVNGGTVEIGLGNTATVKGNGNTAPSTITAVDILTSNGVVHLVDSVLLP